MGVHTFLAANKSNELEELVNKLIRARVFKLYQHDQQKDSQLTKTSS